MILMEMMLEVVIGVLVMEVHKVADEVTDMEVDKVTDMKILIEDLTDVNWFFTWERLSPLGSSWQDVRAAMV